MPLATGDRLGPYEIVALLGRGGMGQVWRAHDSRLNRDVAIKVSAQQFTDRFEREARAIAALNHPNICTLYDVGPNYLVMELIEGPTLADRIAEGPIPLEEALGIAKQIAAALEAAHDKGIVHRDLKPANVKIRPDGSVKVLDFGLAKTAEPAELSSDSPTMLSAVGMILGTAGYMAPEQARAKKEIDKRADIWAFGVVLYEMLTSKRLFLGEDVGHTLASVIMQEPDLSAAPAEVRPLLKRCLEKDPKKRLRDISGVEFLLESSPAASSAPSRSRFGNAGWVAAGVATVIAAALAFVHFREKPPVTHVTRFQYPLPEGQSFTRTGRHDIAISPDGTKLAYVANLQLYLRAMDQLDAQPVRGTNEDPMEPVFSPDGQWLAYFVPASGGTNVSARGAWALKKVAVAGGAPVTLGQLAAAPFGATWRDRTIAFGMNAGSTAGVQAVPDSGGTLSTLLTGDPKKEQLTQPQLLADGKHVLFVALPPGATEGQVVVQTVNGNDRKTLVNGGTDPRVLPSGQLVYIHDGTLLGVPFDVKNLTVTGGPVPLVEGVTETTTSMAGQFAVSSDGTLAFRPGAAGATAQRVLAWVDRQGHEETLPAKPRAYLYPRLSPDGTKIAVNSTDEENDVWVFDLAKDTLTRLTFGPAFDYHPAWTPDNKYLLFSSGPSTGTSPKDIFRKAADGTGTTEALTQHLEGGYPLSLTPDGKSLVFRKLSTPGLFVLPLEPKGEAHALTADPKFTEYNGEISPDGRWIAYDSNESGRYEVYVRPFPAVDSGRWQISSDGGSNPVWSRSGRELFFATAANRMFAVPIPAGATFTYGRPQTLFDTTAYVIGLNSRHFDISADGKRFLMLKEAGSGDKAARPSIVVVSHWFDEVKARMPAR
jgi:serine/threonine-protein kinase